MVQLSDADLEFKRKFLQRLKGQIQTENEMSDKVKAFNMGIAIPESDLRTRTEKIADQNVQIQKLRKNLVELFGDDEESISAMFDYFKDNFADTLFFNQNFKKIYADLDNNIDIEYLNWNYFIAFYERFKEIFQSGKFGTLTAKDIAEANLEALQQQQPPPPTGSTFSPSTPPPTGASTPPPPTPSKTVSLANNERYNYLKQNHSENEYGLAIEDLATALNLNTGIYLTQSGTLRKPSAFMPVINRVFKNASKIIQLRQSGNDDSIDRQKETFSKDLLNRFSTANEAIRWADYVMDTIVTEILDGTYEQIHQNKLQMQSDSVQAKIETEKQMKETKNKQASADAQKKDKQYQKDYQAWEKDRERFYAELEQYQNETSTYAEQIQQFEQELNAYNQEKNIMKKYNKAVDKKYERFEDNLDYLEYAGTFEYDGTTYTFDKTKNALVDDPSNPQFYLYFKMSPDIDNFNIFPVSVRATNFDFNDTMPEPKASVYMTPTLIKPTKPKPPKPPKPMTAEPVRGAGLGRHINYDKDYWTNAKPHVMKPPDKNGGSLKQKMPPKRIINLLAKLGYLIV